MFSLSLEILRLAILLTYNYCYGYPILLYLEYPLILAQQSILFYFVLKYKNRLNIDVVMLPLLIYLTIILFMSEILPKIILEYIIVSIWSIFLQSMSLVLSLNLYYLFDINFFLFSIFKYFCPPLNIISRFTQVFKIISNKSADGISLTTWILTAYVGFGK